MATAKYDESSIEALDGLDGVRAKPAFYLGTPPSELGLFQLAKEAVDNGVDEAQNGYGDTVGISVSDKTSEIWVWDHGRGIPVGVHPKFRKEKRSTLEVIFTILHAGGKLFASQTGYAKSRGCFVGEQKVKLLNGKNVSFEELYERYQRTGKNFWVYSFDIDGKSTFVPRRCTQVHKTMMTRDLCVVTLDNGRKICCTPDHPFLVYEGKYIEAQDLEEGQRLRALYTSLDSDGYEIHSARQPVDNTANHFVAKVRMLRLKEQVPVYDLTVEGEHNYLLEEGVFVHNTHGVGAAVVNALTSELTVYSCRENQWYKQSFSKGKTLTQVIKIKLPPALPGGQRHPKSGTIVRYVPDVSIFSSKSKLSTSRILTWFELQAYIHPKVKFTVVANGKPQTFYQRNGLEDFVTKKITDYKVNRIGKTFVCQLGSVDVALQWSTYSDEDTVSYINGSPTSDGGTHVRGLYKAISESLKPYAGKTAAFKPEDLRFGLLAVLNYSTKSPEFDSQSKSKGVSKTAEKEVCDDIKADLDEFFAKNKTLAKDIITKAVEIRKKTSSFLADKKLVQKVKTAKKALSAKLADVNNPRTPISERELYLIEGDSAGGSFLIDTTLKMQDGTSLSFGEMATRTAQGERFYGYAFDLANKQTVAVELDAPRITRYLTELLEIELEDGTTWSCSLDHPWLLADGTYTAAENLVPGSCLQKGKIPS